MSSISMKKRLCRPSVSLYLSLFPSLCLPVSLSLCLSHSLPVLLSPCLSLYLSVLIPARRSTCVFLPVCPSCFTCLSPLLYLSLSLSRFEILTFSACCFSLCVTAGQPAVSERHHWLRDRRRRRRREKWPYSGRDFL